MTQKLSDRADTRTVHEDTDAIIRTQRKQTFASRRYGRPYRRALADMHRLAAQCRADRCQPQPQPPPPGPSTFQLSREARDRCEQLEIAASEELRRRTPGCALWGLIVLPPGDTRIGSMTLRVTRIESTDVVEHAYRGTARPRQRRAHRRQAKSSGDSDDPDGPAPIDVVIVARRANPARRAALVDLLVELIPAAGGRP